MIAERRELKHHGAMREAVAACNLPSIKPLISSPGPSGLSSDFGIPSEVADDRDGCEDYSTTAIISISTSASG